MHEPTNVPSRVLAHRVTARALALGARLDAHGLERPDTISSTPLAFHVGTSGFVALYRFGVAVLVGLSPVEEDDFIRQIKARVSGERDRVDDETAVLEISADGEDRISPGGPIGMRDLSPQRLLVVADGLAKSVSLGRDEREVNSVLDIIEPFAAGLSRTGRPPGTRRNMLKLIGQALLVQHRVAGRVAVEEKPDVLWDRPDLERLYARVEDEYELQERTRTLKRKLDVIVETAHALTDVIEADRATRLEGTIVILIVMEIILTLAQMFILHR
ncbi:RMD1 family protein [Lichenifustis flavocetrariae]|uniref:RMD1 family protein n=1 Tax=Lichenifustis flavocetrariae TaxID=2949735 RepID=A0AA41Z794_9HYPH|nr:RMD1 family protein [Lichenifustis flavocetrariae]MCW6510557.1 RMD1 family protein [Lichenifustis flavocetrariae]